jgi:3-deoxy-D-manno-octulosonic-acid transferase
VTGDTRFDQVVFRAKEKPLAAILPEPATKWAQTIVAGSTWPEDEEIILPAYARFVRMQPGAKLLLVPHEPSEEHLHKSEAACRRFSLKSQRLSNFAGKKETDVLIVDRMGVLANLYAAGQVAFVGGSFGPGVHNVLEAAAHAIPVLFGPKMRNSPEAIDMVEQGCGFIISTSDEMVALLANFLAKQNEWQHFSDKAARFVTARTGASKKIVEILKDRIVPVRIYSGG